MILALIFVFSAQCRAHERFDRPDPKPPCDRGRVALCVSQHEAGALSMSQQIAIMNERITFTKTEAAPLGVALDDVEKKMRAIDVNLQSGKDEIEFLSLTNKNFPNEKFLSSLFGVELMDISWLEPYPDERKSVLLTMIDGIERELPALHERKSTLKQQLDSYNSSCAGFISARESLQNSLDLHGRMISSGCNSTHCAE